MSKYKNNVIFAFFILAVGIMLFHSRVKANTRSENNLFERSLFIFLNNYSKGSPLPYDTLVFLLRDSNYVKEYKDTTIIYKGIKIKFINEKDLLHFRFVINVLQEVLKRGNTQFIYTFMSISNLNNEHNIEYGSSYQVKFIYLKNKWVIGDLSNQVL